MKIDSHQHFWKFSPETHPWITDGLSVLKQGFYPPDLKKEMDKAGYGACVAVQASQSNTENDFLLGLADQYSYVAGVVGWVDLRGQNVEKDLEKYAGYPKFCGIRHIVQDEPDDRFMLRDDFLQGIGKLKNFGLTYDILTFEKHLPVAVEFVQKFPEQPFVLDHISKPLIKKQVFDPWRENMSKLAAYPNVSCKLSGMVTEADWENWKAEDILPYMETALEAFGATRLMVGSDWPVCKLAANYQEVMSLVENFVSSLSEHEQKMILGENAINFYNLKI